VLSAETIQVGKKYHSPLRYVWDGTETLNGKIVFYCIQRRRLGADSGAVPRERVDARDMHAD
jgi:hypothetical protein